MVRNLYLIFACADRRRQRREARIQDGQAASKYKQFVWDEFPDSWSSEGRTGGISVCEPSTAFPDVLGVAFRFFLRSAHSRSIENLLHIDYFLEAVVLICTFRCAVSIFRSPRTLLISTLFAVGHQQARQGQA